MSSFFEQCSTIRKFLTDISSVTLLDIFRGTLLSTADHSLSAFDFKTDIQTFI